MGKHLISVSIISGVSCSFLPWCTPTLTGVLWLILNDIMWFFPIIPDFYVPWGNCWRVMFPCASFALFAPSWYLKLPLKANLEWSKREVLCQKQSCGSQGRGKGHSDTLSHDPPVVQAHQGEDADRLGWRCSTALLSHAATRRERPDVIR